MRNICCLLLALVASGSAAPHFGYHYDRNEGAANAARPLNHNFMGSHSSGFASHGGGLGGHGGGLGGHGGGLGGHGGGLGGHGGGLGNALTALAQFKAPAPNPLDAFHGQQPPPPLLSQLGQQGGQGYSGDKYLPPETTTQAPIITKQFYLVSAPEDSDEAPRTKHFVIGRPQKNYRVVFIKAPAADNGKLKLSAEYAPQEEKTVIYVLSKKPNELDVGDIATPPPTQPTKPEVFFIKYKTPEEANAAQKEIQEQYDHLGGTSEFSDEGVVPVKSVIGSLDGIAANGGYDYRKMQNVAQSPINEFLQQMRYYF